MAFKNLEQRFNENINKLYAGAKSKFDNGKPSKGANDDPLIVRKPGDGYWNFAESRSTPIVSAANDVKRLTLFTVSTRGILFLAKQQLLQTGNTFEMTRIINPTFAVGNAVPFLHMKRNARPVRELLGKSDPNKAREWGQLQQSTYDAALSKSKKPSFFKKLGDQLLSPIKNTVSAVTAKRNVGHNSLNTYDPSTWPRSRPELGKSDGAYVVIGQLKDSKTFTARTFDLAKNIKYKIKPTAKYTTYIRFSDDEDKSDFTSAPSDDYIQIITERRSWISDTAQKNDLFNRFKSPPIQSGGVKKRNTPKETDDAIETFQINNDDFIAELTKNAFRPNETQPFIKYFETDGIQTRRATNIAELSGNDQNRGKKISYITDPSNQAVSADTYNAQKVQVPYKFINGASDSFDDPITVSFAMGNDDSIRFRAYIKDLQQSISPRYQEFQYIGRIEKFINYTSVQREVSFKLGILAYSSDELETVWRRINYLTGLVFPYGFNRGIHQPNIVRLTIGNVFVDQPGYVSSLNTSFNQLSETWDLDSEVPISAEMDIKYIIIEKATKIAESPFYGITETMDGFSQTIQTPEKIKESLDPKKAPVVSPNTTSVENRNAPVAANNLSTTNRSLASQNRTVLTTTTETQTRPITTVNSGVLNTVRRVP